MLAIDFDKIADAAERTPKQVGWGERTGKGREVYFDGPIWDELRRRCDERGISVSRYLQTLAAMTLGK